MKAFWDERYQQKEYVYGTQPNLFLEQNLGAWSEKGMILFPCEGEGRNAVFAAKSGWEVHAFDFSESGKSKALRLAEMESVNISYSLADALDFDFGREKYDVIAFIFAHFPPDVRSEIHSRAIHSLKPGGRIIIEAFNPNQLKNESGGPKDISMLYTKEMLQSDFEGMDIELLETAEIHLREGKYHEGHADVIRLVATKK